MTDLLVDDADPADMARRFAAHLGDHPDAATDEKVLAGWFATAIAAGRELERDEIASDPEKAARLTGIAERNARRAQLTEAHGKPEHISGADALALAATARIPVDPMATADVIWAHIYLDESSADGWLESNQVHNGHPTLAKVPLPDGRVVGILDLRTALERAREES